MENATKAYADLMGEWQNLMMDNWATWTKATVNSDAFVQGSSVMLDWNLASQNKIREMTGQYLEAVDLPRRADLARGAAGADRPAGAGRRGRLGPRLGGHGADGQRAADLRLSQPAVQPPARLRNPKV